ncbi:hypothetical protein [Solemya elarraichensis gill symbiont]|uniref:Uncharacterized protein n=1 Tax=Solemya elarraichensis gill symbiont TaxID=1918949 RepID=A0A1T2LBI4_9GAMM|nr:hypothetical protein [Solemya elarraichensis gill symbiont]OOZ42479.1 hypothetical protein BOW52_02980 [Solemya elarraichensis gill symbiont]
MLGWLLDIVILKSILPQWFSTALCFSLSLPASFTLLLTGSTELSLMITTFVVLLFMTIMLAFLVLGVNSGIVNWFVRELESGTIKTVVPGLPSIGAMLAFTVGLSGGGQIDDLTSTGWDDYLLKPCKPKDVCDGLAKHLGGALYI